MKARALSVALLWCAAGIAAACAEDRSAPSEAPTYREDVAPILARDCAGCHGGATAAGGFRSSSYLDVIGCVAGAPVTLPMDAHAPLVASLSSPAHANAASADDARVLGDFVRGGAPAFRGTVHDASFVDPRSPAFHGVSLRAARYAPMLDGNDPNACGRCHDGVAKPSGVTIAAPGATACTTCHAQPGAALACPTCHGSADKAYPPRDPCFFAADATRTGSAHAAHVEASDVRATGFACTTCHPAIDPASPIAGTHANGVVDVSCTGTCHDHAGKRPHPTWTDPTPMTCGDCHGAPPANHYRGACTTCHRGANADGTALLDRTMHLNGTVDLGDGSGKCGACHGSGDDPMPKTGAHAAHVGASLTSPIACSTCHVVPSQLHDPGHLDGVVQVVLSGRALDRGARAAWDGAKCSNVACHGAGLPDRIDATPAWSDASGSASACNACHGAPPQNHTAATDCGRSTCHTGEFTRNGGSPAITSVGKMLHVNGVIDVAQ